MRRIFLVLILLLLPSICVADEYMLVMSKEDNVCQHMLKLYNEDLRKHGKVRYDEHEEFTAIKWEGKKYYMMRDGKKEYPSYSYSDNTVLMSRFDINNDGKEEIVIKDEGMLSGIPTQDLYYFKGEDSAYFKDNEFDIKILYNNATGRVGGGTGFERNVYKLKELPKQYIGIILEKEVYDYTSLGGHFYVNPFGFKGSYYIEMKDKQQDAPLLVILKYTRDNQLRDFCYYLKAVDCKNKNQRRK